MSKHHIDYLKKLATSLENQEHKKVFTRVLEYMPLAGRLQSLIPCAVCRLASRKLQVDGGTGSYTQKNKIVDVQKSLHYVETTYNLDLWVQDLDQEILGYSLIDQAIAYTEQHHLFRNAQDMLVAVQMQSATVVEDDSDFYKIQIQILFEEHTFKKQNIPALPASASEINIQLVNR